MENCYENKCGCGATYYGEKRQPICPGCYETKLRAAESKLTHLHFNLQDEKEIVSDEDLDKAYGNANFGSTEKRDVIRYGVLKCVSGYYQGHTSTCIVTNLGLVDKEYKITPKGRTYLWAAFGKKCV